jgi:hypothetical protein
VLSYTGSQQLRAYRNAPCFQINVGNRAHHRVSRIVGRKEIYRRPGPRGILFVSIASAAASFRSTCGSERGAPEYSTQRFPVATPRVGQGTENTCAPLPLFSQLPPRHVRKELPFRDMCRVIRTTSDARMTPPLLPTFGELHHENSNEQAGLKHLDGHGVFVQIWRRRLGY